MIVHWHTEAPRTHLVTQFLAACLPEMYRPAGGPDLVIHSWGARDGAIAYTDGDCRTIHMSDGWEQLTRAAATDRRYVLRPELPVGATIAANHRGGYPARRIASWSWSGVSAGGDGVGSCTPHIELFPFLRERVTPLGGVAERTVGLWIDCEHSASPQAWAELAGCIEKACPGWKVLPLLSTTGLVSRWQEQFSAPAGFDGPEFFAPELERCGTLILSGKEISLAPLALDALQRGCRVLGPREAPYASYLQEGRGYLWSGDPGDAAGVVECLRESCERGLDEERRRRHTIVWARRRSPRRAAAQLQALLRDAENGIHRGRTAGTRPAYWVLRREVGIGDVVFTLSVAWALKQRDPQCFVEIHTAEAHVAWVRWFSFVDRVSCGPFRPRPGIHVGDFEACFPSDSAVDRTLALGQILGIEPAKWTPPPVIPARNQAAARKLLGKSSRPRIAFVPGSRGRSPTRSLPAAMACRTAGLLQDLGEVVWLEEEELPDEPPPGVLNLTGKLTTEELVAVLAECDLCVSVDTGPLHLAVTLRKPVVGLFTHIGALQRLWLAERFLALQPHLPCSPCGEGSNAYHCLRSGSEASWCQNGLPCVAVHRPEEVARAASEALSRDDRVVWTLGPAGVCGEWLVDQLPPPW